MKKIFTLIVSLIFAVVVFAQVPQKMSYQSVIRNSSNQLVTSHVVGMRVSILQGSATGIAVYVETQTPTTNANGLATIDIGGGTAVSGTFAVIDWSTGTYFIKTETDPAGGTSYTITGISQLLSVPYALYANINTYVSNTGDTMYLGSNKVIIPGISIANQLKDSEGNVYKTVKVGNQIWMAENLKTTKFSNGENITESYAYNNDNNNVATYGRLYSWYAVSDSRNICPTGWHVPSESEFGILSSKVTSAPQLKESGTTHWQAPNTGATNSIGFTALPGGYYTGSSYIYLYQQSCFWLSSQASASLGRGVALYYNNLPTTGDMLSWPKGRGLSVRCIKN
jgi:uncharacterized protein (TIGR02145 family)